MSTSIMLIVKRVKHGETKRANITAGTNRGQHVSWCGSFWNWSMRLCFWSENFGRLTPHYLLGLLYIYFLRAAYIMGWHTNATSTHPHTHTSHWGAPPCLGNHFSRMSCQKNTSTASWRWIIMSTKALKQCHHSADVTMWGHYFVATSSKQINLPTSTGWCPIVS